MPDLQLFEAEPNSQHVLSQLPTKASSRCASAHKIPAILMEINQCIEHKPALSQEALNSCIKLQVNSLLIITTNVLRRTFQDDELSLVGFTKRNTAQDRAYVKELYSKRSYEQLRKCYRKAREHPAIQVMTAGTEYIISDIRIKITLPQNELEK